MEALLEVASKAGMEKEQAETATGGVMGLLKSNLEAPQFDSILKQFPGVDTLIKKAQGGGAAAAISGVMGMFGGNKAAGATDIAGVISTLASKVSG